MPLSSQGIAARWLLFTATLATFLHLSKADDNFTDFNWLNETQLLDMFDYENITEWNSTETDGDTDSSWESPCVGATVVESVAENVVESVGETAAESVSETVVESFGETVVEGVGETVVESVIKKSNGSNTVEFPFEKLRLHRHYARILFMVVLLHVAVVGVCIAIYSLIYCKMRTLKKLHRANAQRCLRLMNLQPQHVPNSRECPCSGCIMARDMLQDLFLPHLHEVVEC